MNFKMVGNIWVHTFNFSEKVLKLMVTESTFSNIIYILHNSIHNFRYWSIFPTQSLLMDNTMNSHWFCCFSLHNTTLQIFPTKPLSSTHVVPSISSYAFQNFKIKAQSKNSFFYLQTSFVTSTCILH